jgi:hypothetical protein
VTQDDLLLPVWSMVFAMAQELGSVRAVCRAMGIHLSTYYRWKHQLDRYGPEILRPPERRRAWRIPPGTACSLDYVVAETREGIKPGYVVCGDPGEHYGG